MEILVPLLVFSVVAILHLWDRENIDKSDSPLGTFDSNTVRLNNERKRAQITKLEEKVRKLNDENPGRIFYRDGPRVKEYSPEEVRKINYTNSELRRLNAPYPSDQRHYFIRNGELVRADDITIKRYKYIEKMREINRSCEVEDLCDFDFKNMKLVNKITGAEVEFNPDEYTLAAERKQL